MKQSKKYLIASLGALAAALSLHSHADTPSDIKICIDIKNSTKRVACFDKLAGNLLALEAEKERQSKNFAEIEGRRLENEKIEKEKVEIKRREDENIKQENIEKEKFASIAKEPIKSLRKLQSRIQTGISYRDYPNAVSDAKYEVSSFNRDYSGKTPAYSRYLNDAVVKYADAIAVWKYKFEGRGVEEWIWTTGAVSALTQRYPELSAVQKNAGLRIDSVLQFLWDLAGRDIELADQELSATLKK